MRNIIDHNPEKAILQKHSTNIIGGKLDYDHCYHDCYHEEQLIYQHLLHLVQKESTNQMLNRFRSLFIERANYPESEIVPILDKITASKTAPEEFKFFLNRCCHILINYWHMNCLLHSAIADLISLFSAIPTTYKVNNLRSAQMFPLEKVIGKGNI
ncbi:hypothetical protein MEN24_18720, partial [Dolichospermum sp. ST_sed10]|nr:hypothetical protein [Dolichospermum sp. ST_sed10]